MPRLAFDELTDALRETIVTGVVLEVDRQAVGQSHREQASMDLHRAGRIAQEMDQDFARQRPESPGQTARFEILSVDEAGDAHRISFPIDQIEAVFPQNLEVKGSYSSRLEGFGFFAFPG